MTTAKFRLIEPPPPPKPQLELTLTLNETEARLLFDALTFTLHSSNGSTRPQRAVVMSIRNTLDDAVRELTVQDRAAKATRLDPCAVINMHKGAFL